MRRTAPAVSQAMDEFALRVGYTCGLEQNHKLTEEQAYEKIKTYWKELKRVRKANKVPEVEPVELPTLAVRVRDD